MGYNTTVVVLNDALSNIENDKDLGKKLKSAVLGMSLAGAKPIDIPAGNHCNALLVVETHHADQVVPVLVGGNYGQPLTGTYVRWNDDNPELSLLKALAEKHGFQLHRKRRRL